MSNPVVIKYETNELRPILKNLFVSFCEKIMGLSTFVCYDFYLKITEP